MKSRIKMTRTVTTVEEVEFVVDNDEFKYAMDSHGILLSELTADDVQYALDMEGHEFHEISSETVSVDWTNLRLQGANE